MAAEAPLNFANGSEPANPFTAERFVDGGEVALGLVAGVGAAGNKTGGRGHHPSVCGMEPSSGAPGSVPLAEAMA